MLRHCLPVVAVALLLQDANAQTPPTIVDSYKRGAELFHAAVAAHGGVEALRAAGNVRLSVRGVEYHAYQSRGNSGPLDSTVAHYELLTSFPRLVLEQTRGYVGDFYYTTRAVNAGTSGFTLDLRNRTHTTTSQAQPASENSGDVFLLPQFRLLSVYNGGTSALRALGRMRLSSGTVVEAVHVRFSFGGVTTLGFDPVTKRLVALMSVGGDFHEGDTEVETEWVGYRTLNGVLLPSEWITTRAGKVVNRYRYLAITPNYQIPDSLLKIPAGFAAAPQPPAAEPVRTLANDVWAIRSGSSWTLAVAFRDHVLVFDTQSRGAEDVISRLATLAPGKPVRYVIPSHHHSDHFGGVAAFARAGAITVTTPGNLDYFRRTMSAAPSMLTPAQPVVPPNPSAPVEVIAGKRRVFTDGSRVVEIHDVGPSPHANEILVAWLPAEGILFQADLIEAPNGIATPGSNSPTTVKLADVIRRNEWAVRVFGGSHGFLNSPEEFAKLVAQPIVPPM